MSADNWTMCPRCVMADEEDRAKKSREVNKLYGVVSQEEYVVALNASKERKFIDDSLHENYSVGIENGVFEVTYSASCSKCHFKFEYKYTKDV